MYEAGIVSNRKSESYGEFVPKFYTHRPSNAESIALSKNLMLLTKL